MQDKSQPINEEQDTYFCRETRTIRELYTNQIIDDLSHIDNLLKESIHCHEKLFSAVKELAKVYSHEPFKRTNDRPILWTNEEIQDAVNALKHKKDF